MGKKQRLMLLPALAAAGALVVSAAGVCRATITGSVSAPATSSSGSPISISAGALDWVYYGYSSADTENVKSGGPDSISALFTEGDGTRTLTQGTDSQDYIGWTGGTPTASVSETQDFVYDGGTETIGDGLNFDQTVQSNDETVNIYLVSDGSVSDLSATLSGGGNSYSQNVDLTTVYSPQKDGVHGYGLVTLTITNALDQTLAFNDVQGTSSGYVGIQAVSVVVPEPAGVSLLVLGAIGTLMVLPRRRRFLRSVDSGSPR